MPTREEEKRAAPGEKGRPMAALLGERRADGPRRPRRERRGGGYRPPWEDMGHGEFY